MTDVNQRIDASPTKDFFISILVRDIKLVDAISDLVDNCVDGARRLRTDSNYTGLHLTLEAKPDCFIIADNCGGISAKIAREYAFRFGRPVNVENTPHSIGQFGVGMKRALFKIGSKIKIESTASDSKFVINIDVDAWKNPSYVDEYGKERWDFEFETLEENLNNPADKCSTVITVTKLHEGIANEFKLVNFVTRLIANIEAAHQSAIGNNLKIAVNDIDLEYRQSSLLSSKKLLPLCKSIHIPKKGKDVTVRIYAGISDAKLIDAGWYVFCNERLVLRADKSQVTGWDQEVNGVHMPKPHYQFARFRGYIFFDSDSADVLPWNTTKNGVDVESSLYQAAKLEMVNAMRPVIDFLNALDNEMDTESTALQSKVNEAKPALLRNIVASEIFVYPKVTDVDMVNDAPKEGRISYLASYEKIDRIKELTGCKTNPAVGLATFNYFLKSMGEE